MDVCSRNPNRTAPVGEEGCGRADVPLCSRTNGWSWPPHPFQLLAWLLYIYFAVTGFGVFVPLLPPHWIPAGYICTGVMFVCHLCVHFLAVSVDPADHNVRTRSHQGPVPVFDRSKHAHVIENCHCYLCQVDVGPKSKHCSACNKCVADFDHHCRWLNNCYCVLLLFLHSVVSALLGVCLVLVVSSYVFIEFFMDPSKLRTDKHFLGKKNETGVWFVFLPVAPLRSAAAVIPVLAAVTIALSLLSSGLLCHLLCFHIYLMWNRLSTYEYIVRQRHRVDSRDSRKPRSVREACVLCCPLQDVSYSGTLGYTNSQLDVQEPTTVAVRGEAEFLANGRVISVSSPVMEEEAPPTHSTERKAATHRHTQVTHTHTHTHTHTYTHTHTHRKHTHTDTQISNFLLSSAEPVSSVSLGQRLPFPAFPLKSSLLPLAPSGPVQAAAPCRVPLGLGRVSGGDPGGAGQAGLLGGRRRLHVLAAGPALPPALPPARTKRKASRPHRGAVELRFEMASTQPPSVFVSRASGEAAEPRDEGLSLGRRAGGRPPGAAAASWMER
uniref:Palmitoyltransferase n=1 Tax=Amphiprion percula TaxID=161767 RepID=A0A3P8RIY8_AMPPE